MSSNRDGVKLSKVIGTDNCFFDPHTSTFRLYCGKSLYAFAIADYENFLEHLYWGPALPPDSDLRYLSQDTRYAHFFTYQQLAGPQTAVQVAAETNDAEEKTILEEGSKLDELQHSFNNNNQKPINSGEIRALGELLMRKNSFDGDNTSDTDTCTTSEISTALRNATNDDPELIKSEVLAQKRQDAEVLSPKRRFLETLQRSAARKQFHSTANKKKIGKGLLMSEYSDYGTGDFRTPSFMVVDNFNGSNVSPLRYRHHSIYLGKLPMPDNMPGVRVYDEAEASTLVVTMEDKVTGLEVDLIYVVMHDYDVIMRRVVFRNMDTRPRRPGSSITGNSENSIIGNSKVIQKASSMTIDLEGEFDSYYMTQLSGSWGRERYIYETKLCPGKHSIESLRGVSGHEHNPFAVISSGQPHENHGEVKAFSLVYSGNFLIETEVNEMGRLRCNAGIHPMTLQWHLDIGEEFSTPEVVMARSNKGLGGVSRTLHRLVLDHLIPKHWSDKQPPVLLNSWEAKFFHVNHDNIVEMARQAATVGIDMIVVDDGWYGKRNTEDTSLGDWEADPEKFPHGMTGLAEEVNAAGCKLGLWFEPEMVSEESNLFKAHPDWHLHIPGRPRLLGRNQLVLDLSRREVVDHIYDAMANILTRANIEYIKWDMNRPLTEVFSVAAQPGEVWQGEIAHRWLLGLYDLQNRIITNFPHILLENCVSGGGRFDLGMLYYSPQQWVSDNSDALCRIKIQYGTSLAYPVRTFGAHVSVSPNFMTGMHARLRTRAFMAMNGSFGYELDIGAVTPKDLVQFQNHIKIFKRISPTIRFGDLYRLWNPFKGSYGAWMYVARDKSHAIVFAFSQNSDHWSSLVPRLRLRGLEADAEYEITEPIPNNIKQGVGSMMIQETEVAIHTLGHDKVCLSGQTLMSAGLPARFYTPDDCAVYELTRV